MSLGVIVVVGAVAIGGTVAWFWDVEKSSGNTFKAGELDLKIDNTCHYNGMVCECTDADVPVCTWKAEDSTDLDSYVETETVKIGDSCACTWAAKDLDGERFYDYDDIKPGDWGEHTLSIRVDNNDAWGRILTTAIENREHGCTEPESDVDGTCTGRWCGELAQNMYTFSWKDDGVGGNPSTKGDNIYQTGEDILTDSTCDGAKDYNGQTYCPVLSKTSAESTCTYMMGYNPQGDLPGDTATQITSKFSLTGGVTYYIGTAWFVPFDVDNIIQGDSIKADISFEIEQKRHNTNPF